MDKGRNRFDCVREALGTSSPFGLSSSSPVRSSLSPVRSWSSPVRPGRPPFGLSVPRSA